MVRKRKKKGSYRKYNPEDELKEIKRNRGISEPIFEKPVKTIGKLKIGSDTRGAETKLRRDKKRLGWIEPTTRHKFTKEEHSKGGKMSKRGKDIKKRKPRSDKGKKRK